MLKKHTKDMTICVDCFLFIWVPKTKLSGLNNWPKRQARTESMVPGWMARGTYLQILMIHTKPNYHRKIALSRKRLVCTISWLDFIIFDCSRIVLEHTGHRWLRCSTRWCVLIEGRSHRGRYRWGRCRAHRRRPSFLHIFSNINIKMSRKILV